MIEQIADADGHVIEPADLPADHVALASDWPHYDGTPHLLEGFRNAGRGFAEDDLHMIATRTFDRWFPES